MAALATELVKQTEFDNTIKLMTGSHTVSKPQLVIQKRRVPSGNQTIAEDNITLVFGTVDADSKPHANNILFEVKLRRPFDAASADITAAKALLQDIVSSDEFADVIDSSLYLPYVLTPTP